MSRSSFVNRPLFPTLAGAVLLLISGVASAAAHTIAPAGDTYVRRDNGGPYGSEAHLIVKNRGDSDMTRKVLVRFSMGWRTYSPMEASLSLDVSDFGGATSATFNIFGIANPHLTSADCDITFDESTIRYRDLSYLDDSGDGVKNESGCIYRGTPLGTLVVRASDIGRTVTFSNAALREFIRENSPFFGVATFLITRVETSRDLSTAFASKEHPTLQGPRLSWTDPDDLAFEGANQPSVNTTSPQRFTGNLKLPLPGGQYVTLPGADVTVTYWGGKLQTISGRVGMPQLPDTGIFQQISLSGPELLIGYDYPSAFNSELELPLDPGTKYFYLAEQSGLSIDVGGLLSLSSPSAGQSLIVFDPASSTFFGYSSQIPFGELPIEDVSLGFSGGDNILFIPWDDDGVSTQMAQFQRGNFYLGGTLGFDLQRYTAGPVSFGAEVAGNMTVKADPTGFASRNQDWLRAVGVNGAVSASANLGEFTSLSLDIGQGTMLFQRYAGGRSQPSFTFAGGVHSPGRIGNLPFGFKGDVHADGHIDLNDNGAASFVELYGDLDFGSKFVEQSISGKVRLGASGASFGGQASFAGFKINVDGTVTSTYTSFSGSQSVSYGFSDGLNSYKVKATIRASFDTRGTSGKVNLSADAKACLNGDCFGVGISELQVKSDGHIKICVRVAGQNACESL